MKIATAISAGALLFAQLATRAEPPACCYAPALGKAGSELRSVLHAIIRDHQVIPYDSAGINAADALKVLDQDPANAENVLLLCSTSSVSAASFDSGWNREHMWCKAYGFDRIEPAYSYSISALVIRT